MPEEALSLWERLNDFKYTPRCGQQLETIPSGVYRCYFEHDRIIFELQRENTTDALLPFEDTIAQDLLKKIQQFWNSRDVFNTFEFLFKRGILLYGPPGSGKTAAISLVVSDVISKHNGIVIYSDNPYPLVSGLPELRKIESTRPVICVFEDIDNILHEYGPGGEQRLLSILDGEANTSNIVFIATTNHIEDLPERIHDRPSRFDEKIFVGFPSRNMRAIFIKHKVPDIDQTTLETWAEDTDGLSIAHIKELILSVLCLQQDYQETLSRLKSMKYVKRHKSSSIGLTIKPGPR